MPSGVVAVSKAGEPPVGPGATTSVHIEILRWRSELAMTKRSRIKKLLVLAVLLSVALVWGLMGLRVIRVPTLSDAGGLQIPDYCHPSHVVEPSISVDEWKLYSDHDGWLLVTKGSIAESSLANLKAFPFELASLRPVPREWRESLARAYERRGPEMFSDVLVEATSAEARARCVVITSFPREIGDKIVAELTAK